MKITCSDDFSELSDDCLVKAIQQGNEELLAVIFKRYRPLVSKFASRFSFLPWEQDDYVQEGLIALYSAVRLYDFSSATFSAFASVCVKRAMISLLRHSNKARHIADSVYDCSIHFESSFSDNPEAHFIDKETSAAFISEIKQELSLFEYTVLSRYLLLGNYGEVADSLGITKKETDNALQRARRKIKKINSNCC